MISTIIFSKILLLIFPIEIIITNISITVVSSPCTAWSAWRLVSSSCYSFQWLRPEKFWSWSWRRWKWWCRFIFFEMFVSKRSSPGFPAGQSSRQHRLVVLSPPPRLRNSSPSLSWFENCHHHHYHHYHRNHHHYHHQIIIIEIIYGDTNITSAASNGAGTSFGSFAGLIKGGWKRKCWEEIFSLIDLGRLEEILIKKNDRLFRSWIGRKFKSINDQKITCILALGLMDGGPDSGDCVPERE